MSDKALDNESQVWRDAANADIASLGRRLKEAEAERDRLRGENEELSSRPDWKAYNALRDERDFLAENNEARGAALERRAAELALLRKALLEAADNLDAAGSLYQEMKAHIRKMVAMSEAKDAELARLREAKDKGEYRHAISKSEAKRLQTQREKKDE